MTKSLSQQADKLDEGFTKIAERRQEFDQQQKDVREQPVESVDVSSEVWFPPAGRAYHCSV